ncbi:hypothetical protein [Haloferula sp. BvORR071]|uniref:hypothetical protein n=1 Tax=Haloferula sp. BvORR071 TaxID=1396141 RepID=UPI000554D435|nr:hypothetical protein [Haloferula sp. BvORR071]
MEISLHDNWIYAHQVDHDSGVIALRTVFPHTEPHEFTDVIFEGLLAHHFQNQCMGLGGPYPLNVLFDIEEGNARTTLDLYRVLFSPRKTTVGLPAAGTRSRNWLSS